MSGTSLGVPDGQSQLLIRQVLTPTRVPSGLTALGGIPARRGATHFGGTAYAVTGPTAYAITGPRGNFSPDDQLTGRSNAALI